MSKPTSSRIERRSFLKLGLTGIAGLGTGSTLLRAETAGGSPQDQERKMIHRTLGRTGYELPIVSMGVMNADNPALVAAALDAGIVLLDTAWGYQRGRNETMIGKVIEGRPRDSFVLATKVPGDRDRETGNLKPDSSPEEFRKKFDQSLERLGLEHVDILYLHGVRRGEDAQSEPMIKALQDEKKRGRTRFIGVTTHQNEPEVIRGVLEAGVYDVILTAYNFRKDYIEDLRAAVSDAAAAGLGIVAMKTQAGVYWDREKTDPINMTAALKYVLQDPNVHTAIPGFTTFDQMKLDLTVMNNLSFTQEELEDLRLGETVGGLYCQACERCIPQCPQQLPIPDMMRGYMYAHGYRNLEAAHELVTSLEVSDNPCGDCSGCAVRCAKSFDVKDRIEDIVRIKGLSPDFFA
jgi:predicted aldo/keto reductase-like oxidoreductase